MRSVEDGLRFFIFLFFVAIVHIAVGFVQAEPPTEIDLKGKIGVAGAKSLDDPIPIDASTDGQSIFINFLTALGDVTISIYNVNGDLVYQSNEQITSVQQLLVSIANLSSGSYTLVFTNAGGGYVYGTFTK